MIEVCYIRSMKTILLAGALLLGGAETFAQVTPVTASFPLKQANVVVARTPDSLKIAFTKLTRALLAAGYGLEKSDEGAGFLATTPRAAKDKKAVYVRLRFALLPEQGATAIEVRGDYSLSGALGETPISNKGQSGSATAAAWAEMQRAAALYPEGILAYRRQP
jgi:hypothetical protein